MQLEQEQQEDRERLIKGIKSAVLAWLLLCAPTIGILLWRWSK